MTPQDKEVLQSFIATEIEKDEFYRIWTDYEREHPDHRIGDPYSIGVAVGVSRIKKKLEKFLRLDEDFVDSICERIGINLPYLDGDSWCVLLGSDIQSGICGFGRTKFEALMDFMKSIILQTKNSQAMFSHWKPSEEQMKALWEVEDSMRANKAFTLSNRLASLYNDLQKLL